MIWRSYFDKLGLNPSFSQLFPNSPRERPRPAGVEKFPAWKQLLKAKNRRGSVRSVCQALSVVDYVTLDPYGSGTKQKWVWGSGPASMPPIAAPARGFAFGAGPAARADGTTSPAGPF